LWLSQRPRRVGKPQPTPEPRPEVLA